ncbi:hypothetical protein DNTS_013249, partial [Danionella cerebrum]
MNKLKDSPLTATEMLTNNATDHKSHCGTEVARARWGLLRQVLKQKQLDSADVQQVSVRRFSSFQLFSRSRVSQTEWVEYRSATFPQYSALLRDSLGPIRMDEVLSSFDNTGNV